MTTTLFRKINMLNLTLICITLLFTPFVSAELFDESEVGAQSLDDRIKALEQSIKLENSAGFGTSANIGQKKLDFKTISTDQTDSSTLEQEVQELKGEIIEFNKELAILEEDLLSPVSTQMSVFLSIDQGEFFQLDGIKVEIDGEVVEHHLYTKQEISALAKGAMQRLHTTNLVPGDHKLVMILSGYSSDGRDVKKAASYNFYKQNSKKYIEFAINDNETKQKAEFEFSEWQ